MLASIPASMLNQNPPDLGIPNRINLKASRFRNKPKTPPDSKTNHATAFFDSIGPTRKFLRATGKSASPSATDIVCRTCEVRKVPMGNIDLASRHRRYQLTAYQGFLTSKANRTLPGRPPH